MDEVTNKLISAHKTTKKVKKVKAFTEGLKFSNTEQ